MLSAVMECLCQGPQITLFKSHNNPIIMYYSPHVTDKEKTLFKVVVGARIYWYGYQVQWTTDLSATGSEGTIESVDIELDFE